eukprot:2068656-Karenia_brevis.AAC.1
MPAENADDGGHKSAETNDGMSAIQSNASSLSCPLCRTCCSALGACPPRMPWRARARGMWRGPEPQELAVLSMAERCVIQLARLHICLHRVQSWTDKKFPQCCEVDPYEHSGNMVAYPLEAHAFAQGIGVRAASLPSWIQVIFEGEDKDVVRKDPALK